VWHSNSRQAIEHFAAYRSTVPSASHLIILVGLNKQFKCIFTITLSATEIPVSNRVKETTTRGGWWTSLTSRAPELRRMHHQTVQDRTIALDRRVPYNFSRPNFDFGILKWPTSAVCFGPPRVKRTSSLDLSDELGSGGGSWTGEPRWSYR
jgi:hypothetical protein